MIFFYDDINKHRAILTQNCLIKSKICVHLITSLLILKIMGPEQYTKKPKEKGKQFVCIKFLKMK